MRTIKFVQFHNVTLQFDYSIDVKPGLWYPVLEIKDGDNPEHYTFGEFNILPETDFADGVWEVRDCITFHENLVDFLNEEEFDRMMLDGLKYSIIELELNDNTKLFVA